MQESGEIGAFEARGAEAAVRERLLDRRDWLARAAAGAALLAPGDATVMRHALATAGTFASGLQQAFRSESMTKPLHAGHAASVGVTSAMAAATGVTGAEDLLDGEAGFVAAMSDGARWDAVLPSLGTHYNITRVTFKNHGCCGHAFAALDAVLELGSGLDPAAIERVDVETYKAAIEVAGIADPQGAPDAKFSIPYLIAHALIRGSVRLDAYDEQQLRNPAIRALLKRVTLREDPALSADFPGKRAARVKITPYQSAMKGSMETGVCLSSGSPDIGSTTGLVRAPTRASEAYASFQWIGANATPAGTSPSVRTRTTMDPQAERTRASSPARTANLSASATLTSMKGSATCDDSRADLPVRVMVCQ